MNCTICTVYLIVYKLYTPAGILEPFYFEHDIFLFLGVKAMQIALWELEEVG